jgi:isopentenyl-diphosphate delta-isomerase
MKKVAPIDKRKSEHLRINLEEDVLSSLSTGLEKYHFIHEALPDQNLDSVDSSLDLFEKKLDAPILISSMTGGTSDAVRINRTLAEAAQYMKIAMGVGSQRAALENPDLVKTFSISRKYAPDILLFANLGAIQLNYGYDISHCRRAIDMLQADALILHLNPLQEALQSGGNVNFIGLAKKIEHICQKIEVPVIVKEVGWGISDRTARLLANCGVSAIDVSGAGGTSWSQVEMFRAPDTFHQDLAATFIGWGIPTAESIKYVQQGAPGMKIFASGGLKNGMDIAKCIALGATLGGMAGQFLRAATISAEKVIEQVKLIQQQIRIIMFANGVKDLVSLQNDRLVELI